MFIYIARGPDAVKVGRSASPEKRRGTLQIGSPEPLSLAYHVECGDRAPAVEKEAKRLLDNWRIRGEWFRCPVALATLAVEAALTGCERRSEYLRLRVIAEKETADITASRRIDTEFSDFERLVTAGIPWLKRAPRKWLARMQADARCKATRVVEPR